MDNKVFYYLLILLSISESKKSIGFYAEKSDKDPEDYVSIYLSFLSPGVKVFIQIEIEPGVIEKGGYFPKTEPKNAEVMENLVMAIKDLTKAIRELTTTLKNLGTKNDIKMVTDPELTMKSLATKNDKDLVRERVKEGVKELIEDEDFKKELKQIVKDTVREAFQEIKVEKII